MLQVFPWAITYSDGLLIHAAAKHASQASVPVAIHLDHAQDEALIKHAAVNLPFDSIMVDMSHYEMAENLSKTRELVAFCNKYQITTEAEPGRIEGGEDGVEDTFDLEGALTTPEQVDDFLATGIDFLAPAFGNVHGEYGPDGPVGLKYELLDSIRSRTKGKLRIALHGTNDFPADVTRKCVAGGCSKINVNKLVLDDYLEYLKANSGDKLTTMMEEGTKKIQKAMEVQMDICGSSGKA